MLLSEYTKIYNLLLEIEEVQDNTIVGGKTYEEIFPLSYKQQLQTKIKELIKELDPVSESVRLRINALTKEKRLKHL